MSVTPKYENVSAKTAQSQPDKYAGVDQIDPSVLQSGVDLLVSINKVNGKQQVYGYFMDSKGDDLVILKSAPQDLQSMPGYQKVATDAGTGAVRLATPQSAIVKNPSGAKTTLGVTQPAASGATPNTSGAVPGSDNAITGVGSYPGAGASTAIGNLNSANTLEAGRDTTNLDTSKLGVTMAEGSGGMTPFGIAPTTTSTVQAQVDDVFQKTPDERTLLAKQLTAAGYGPSDGTVYGLAQAYEKALLDLNQMETANGGNTHLDWNTFLAQQTTANASGATNSKTTTHTTVDLTDPATAQSLLSSALGTALGKQPTPAQIAQFTASLDNAQKANPAETTTTTTGTADAGGNTAGTTTESGGMTDAAASQYATNWVQQNFPGQVNADKAGTLFQILNSALSGPTA